MCALHVADNNTMYSSFGLNYVSHHSNDNHQNLDITMQSWKKAEGARGAM